MNGGYELRDIDGARPDRTGAFYNIRKGGGGVAFL